MEPVMSAVPKQPARNLQAHTPGRRSFTARKWQIRAMQLQMGMEPCFSTEYRHVCRDTDCPWRDQCKVLRAEWRR